MEHEMQRVPKHVDGPRVITVVLQLGPLHGERMDDVPWNAVSFLRGLDDGTVVTYRRWEDNVWRFDDQTVS